MSLSAEQTCRVCGGPVKVYSSGEGTCSYEPDTSALDASHAQAEALAEGLSRIAHQATDLPHAQRIDRDEMRAVAWEALAAYRKGQAHSADDPQRKADRAGA